MVVCCNGHFSDAFAIGFEGSWWSFATKYYLCVSGSKGDGWMKVKKSKTIHSTNAFQIWYNFWNCLQVLTVGRESRNWCIDVWSNAWFPFQCMKPCIQPSRMEKWVEKMELCHIIHPSTSRLRARPVALLNGSAGLAQQGRLGRPWPLQVLVE